MATVTHYSKMSTAQLIKISCDSSTSDQDQLILCDILFDRIPDQQKFDRKIEQVMKRKYVNLS